MGRTLLPRSHNVAGEQTRRVRLGEPPTDCRLCPIRGLSLFRPFEGAALARLNSLRAMTRAVSATMPICAPGLDDGRLYTVFRGWAFSYRLLEDGKRQIVLATDRPVSFAEAYDQSRLGDFDVTIILLTVDAEGKGEGLLSMGTEVKWNDSTNKLEITNVSSQPIKLGDVRRVD